LNRETLRQAIYDVVEYLTKHPLSDNGKKLVIHYFNQSKESSSFQRAIDAANRYFPESMPTEDERPPALQNLIENLESEAESWDNEDA
jgi:hypothetical protein